MSTGAEFPNVRRVPRLGPDGRVCWVKKPATWSGVRVGTQEEANRYLPELISADDSSCVLRFVVLNPLPGPIDLFRWLSAQGFNDALSDIFSHVFREPIPRVRAKPGIDWVILGGGARPVHPDWVRGLRDQCTVTGVPFFFVGWGEWLPVSRPTDADEVVWASNTYQFGRWLDVDGGVVHRSWDTVMVDRVGKKASGRTLDGRTWDQVPSVEVMP